MAIVQISKIIHRTGDAIDLPQLDIGEIGFASDTRQVFIGNDPVLHPTVPGELTTQTEILTDNSYIGMSQLNSVVGVEGSDVIQRLSLANVETGHLIVADVDTGNSITTWYNAGGNVARLITLGDAQNVKIQGANNANSRQVIKALDNSGNLDWVDNNLIENTNSNIVIPSPGSNINFSIGGTSNLLVLTSTGANLTGTANIVGNTQITGNLWVTGTTTYVNVTSVNITDPIVEQGKIANGGTLSTNDGKDRGSLLHYFTTQPVEAFMGWDNSNGEFAMGSNVSVTNEVVTFNTYGNLRLYKYFGNYLYISANANVGNLQSEGIIVAIGNITGANLNTAGQANIQSNIYLTGSTENIIDWGGNGAGVPTTTTRSTGTKLVLNNNLSAGLVDDAIGIESDGKMWFSVRQHDVTEGFTWYGGTNAVAALTSTGKLTLEDTTESSSTSTGGLITKGGAGVVKTLRAGNVITPGYLDVTGYANVTSTLDVMGQITGHANITGVNLMGPLANGSSNVNMPTVNGNINLTVNGTANVVVVTNVGANVSGNIDVTANANVGNLTTTGNVTASNLMGSHANGTSNVNIPSVNGNVTVSVSGTGNVAVFTTNGIEVTANITAGNIVGPLSNGTSNINIPAASGNVNISVNGTSNVLTVASSDATLTGNLGVTANVTASRLISNIATGTEPITVTSTTRVGNLSVAYANVSDYGVVTAQTTGTYYPVFVSSSSTGNLALGSNSSINVSLATGTLSATLLTGTLTTAAQPNVTSTGTLNGLTASGTINLTSASNVSLGSNANVHISGGTANYVLQTDGSGSLSWRNTNLQTRQTINSPTANLSAVLNGNNGGLFDVTMDMNTTFNTIPNATAGTTITVIFRQDATGNRTLTSTMKFAGGSKTLTTTANAIDVMRVFYDGTNYFADLSKNYS